MLDAELAALLWLLVEGRVPIVVAAGPPRSGKTTLLTALLDFLPVGVTARTVGGLADDLAWLPDAEALGWTTPTRDDRRAPDRSAPRLDPSRTCLLVAEVSNHLPDYAWGLQARVLVRAVQRGWMLATTAHADSLQELLATLQAPPVALSEDELRFLGVVLVLRAVAGAEEGVPRRRIVAAHYLRPLERDRQGHLQRRPPAVLATWDPAEDAFEHFAWGVVPELGVRIGRTPGDFEREQAERAAYLEGLVGAGLFQADEVRRAIAGFRRSDPGGSPS